MVGTTLCSTDFRQFQEYRNLTGLDVSSSNKIVIFNGILSIAYTIDGYSRRLLLVPYPTGEHSALFRSTLSLIIMAFKDIVPNIQPGVAQVCYRL